MMKKTTRTLLLVFSSLLLLVSVTVSASAQRGTISGQIRWHKEMGVLPMGPGHSQPAVNPCHMFTIAVLDPANNYKPITYTDQVASPFTKAEDGDFHVCKYKLSNVPTNKGLYITATMGGVLLLPKEDRDPMFITDAWIGGSRSKPPRGYERGFTGHKYWTLGVKGLYLKFTLTYIRVDPN